MPVKQTSKLTCAIFNTRNALTLVAILIAAFFTWYAVNETLDSVVIPLVSWLTGNTHLSNRCFILRWGANPDGIGIAPSIMGHNVGGWSDSNNIPCHSIAAQGGIVLLYGDLFIVIIRAMVWILVLKFVRYLRDHGPLGSECITNTACDLANQGCDTSVASFGRRGGGGAAGAPARGDAYAATL